MQWTLRHRALFLKHLYPTTWLHGVFLSNCNLGNIFAFSSLESMVCPLCYILCLMGIRHIFCVIALLCLMLFILSAKTNSYADLKFCMFMKILGLTWNWSAVPLLICLYGLVNYLVLTFVKFHCVASQCFPLFMFLRFVIFTVSYKNWSISSDPK
jgi:hypothetical protein